MFKTYCTMNRVKTPVQTKFESGISYIYIFNFFKHIILQAFHCLSFNKYLYWIKGYTLGGHLSDIFRLTGTGAKVSEL